MQSTLTQGFASSDAAGPRREAFLFRVLDADAPLTPSARFSLSDVDEVKLGRGDTRATHRSQVGATRVLSIEVADRWMSGQHARVSRVMRRWVLEDAGSKNGVRLNGALVTRAELEDGDVFELGRTFFVFRAAQPITKDAASDLESDRLADGPPGLATLQPELTLRLEQVRRIAASTVTVALTGESGSGKEVLARAIHALSGRSGPFIAVNCGALPAELVESELFGHRKGAFSGATEDRPGLVRAAHGGTLFLDEVGDLPLAAQPALLRVLQEKQVLPVGATTPLPVDLRVISATHRDLVALCQRNSFRDDLRARLSGFQLALPRLVERREDLGLLVASLLKRVSGPKAASVQLSLPVARALFTWTWPLNVRELEKALEAAVVLADGRPIELEHLPEAMRGGPAPEQKPSPPKATPQSADDEALKARLVAMLTEHRGNVSAVARAMGKARMQIQRWMARFGLDPQDFKRQ
ncbi:MAG: sigma 54-interacting transcriptional regulator [Myxococcota bacterium]